MRAIIAYVPVLHEGYLRFFQKHRGLPIFVLGPDLIRDFRPLVKDIRALHPELIVKALKGLGIFSQVEVLSKSSIPLVHETYSGVIMPDEDETRALSERFFLAQSVEFEKIFLRWDATRSLSQTVVEPDAVLSSNRKDQELINLAYKLSEDSSDWWRQIGGMVVRDGEVILTAWNKHVPNDHVLIVFGDPRANFRKGIHTELSTALHVEASLVAQAAKRGISLEGASLYCTVFPCPPCARVVSYSGIKRLFYAEGYAMLDGEDLLRSQSIEIIKVETPPE